MWSNDENTSGQNYSLSITSNSNGSLSILGPDEVGQNNAGIVCSSLEMNGSASVKAWAGKTTGAYSYSAGIVGQSLSVSGNASLEAASSDAAGKSNGILLQYSPESAVTVADNASVKASSGTSGYDVNSGIYTGVLNVSGNGEVEAYGNVGPKTSAGIYARGGSVQIGDNASVYAAAKEAQKGTSYGIYSYYNSQSSIILTGGSLTAVGELLAVYPYPVDLTNYPGAYSVTASRNTDGSNPVVYNPSNSYKYLNITPHTHQWSTQWSSDDTCHWHECTDADCPVTDNSQKDGYAAHTYDQKVVSDTYKASDATCMQTAAYYYSCVCGAKGTETFTDGQTAGHKWGSWQSNGNGTHTRTCQTCTEPQTENCAGGTATCTSKAVCGACGAEYGETDPDNHTGIAVWVQTAATHKQEYSCCHAEISAEETHNWENEKCTVCLYPCAHEGGVATCTQKAVCTTCGSEYGEVDPDNHNPADEWTQANDKHYHICEYGCDTHFNEANCSGGTATCTQKAVCETCRQTYGSVNSDNHTGKAVWTQTETTHSSAYNCCGAVVITEETHEWEDGVCSECGYECRHSGGEATCTEQATCEICHEKYGALSAHKLSLMEKVEAACTTDGREAYYTCEACGKYFEDEAGNTEITNLDVYGIIPASGHKAGTEWKSDGTGHWNECVNCGEKLNEAAHDFEWVTDKEATATKAGSRHEECTVCGYAKAAVEIPATGTTANSAKPNTPDDTRKPAGTTNSTSPQTGDDSNIALWIVLMFAAAAGITGSYAYNYKKKSNR